MKQLFTLCLLAVLASCQEKPDSVQAAINAQRAAAKADSLHAARLDSTAKSYYALGRQAEDSAAILHLQTHVKATATPVDTAALRRFFAGY